jgi:MoaA/NifB/PqqE/SkfB family radical SAM enzyme
VTTAPFRLDRAPLRVHWEVTRACDLTCRHCRAEAQSEPDPDELSTPMALRLLDRLAEFAAPHEPPLHLVLTG